MPDFLEAPLRLIVFEIVVLRTVSFSADRLALRTGFFWISRLRLVIMRQPNNDLRAFAARAGNL